MEIVINVTAHEGSKLRVKTKMLCKFFDIPFLHFIYFITIYVLNERSFPAPFNEPKIFNDFRQRSCLPQKSFN